MITCFLFGSGSYEILNFSHDARSLSLHNAASAYDRSQLRNNPASLSLTNEQTTYSYLILPADIHSGEIQRVRKRGLGIHAVKLSFINYGTIVDDETRRQSTAYEILFGMGYKMELKNIVSLGISGGYLLSSISGYNSQMLYSNIGIRSRMMKKRMGLGFSLENIGLLFTSYTIVRESIPTIFRSSMYYRPKYLPAIINIDIIRYLNRDATELSYGLEFNPEIGLTFRIGLSSDRTDFLTGDFSSDLLVDLSAGIGFKFNKINLDVGYKNLGAIGYIVGFSIVKRVD